MTQGFSPYSGGSFGSSSGGFSGAESVFPSGAPTTGSSGTVLTQASSAPILRLLPSLVLGVIGLVLNAVITFGPHEATDTSFAVMAFLGWGLAGVVGISLLGLYFSEDNRRRGAGFYTEIDWKKVVYWITIGVLVVAIFWSSVDIAQWAGKL